MKRQAGTTPWSIPADLPRLNWLWAISVVLIPAPGLRAAAPSVADALKLKPVQADVQYDTPTEAEMEQCKINSFRSQSARGWLVQDPHGQPLRRFVDTNGDNKVDQWCYFLQGVEVYRDIDSDFNMKADQHRWLGTAGTKWGVDRDEDGRIDHWKWISAPEVAAEAVMALAQADAARLRAILITPDDLTSLGITGNHRSEIQEKANHTLVSFQRPTDGTLIPRQAKWVYFGAVRPGLVPADDEELKSDLIVYENTASIYEVAGKQQQLPLGTMIKTENGWRLIEIPIAADSQRLAGSAGYFFQASLTRPPASLSPETPAMDPKVQKLLQQLEQVDRQLAAADSMEAQARLQRERADLLEQLYGHATSSEEKENWMRQLADTIAAAVQTGEDAASLKRLQQLAKRVTENKAPESLQAFVQFRLIAAEYASRLTQDGADPAKVQEAWLKQLESFIQKHPTAEDAPEAMLQLAVTAEFNGDERTALRWYEQIVSKFPQSPQAEKAAGAVRRLNCTGKSIGIQGQTISGSPYSLVNSRGKPTVVVYWATWCEPCVAELDVLKDLYARYGARGLQVVTINLDVTKKDVEAFLAQKRYPWPTLFEEGGLDSRLAKEMGILTLPATLLIDRNGKVVSRNVQPAALESQVRKLVAR